MLGLGIAHDALRVLTPLFILRVLSPAFVLVTALSVIPTRPPAPQSPSPITPVVVATRTPRRALILALLSLVSLTFFLDGITVVIYAVLDKAWHATGIEFGALEGVTAFAGLAILGAWKDLRGVDVWFMKRVKAGIALAFFLDIAQVALLILAVRSESFRACQWTYLTNYREPEPFSIRSLLHVAFPAFRVLLLLPLLVTLFSPRISYTPVSSDDETVPTASSLLLPADEAAVPSTGLSPLAAEASKYGTFRTSHSAVTTASGPTTRAPTPAPSNIRVPRAKVMCQEKLALHCPYSSYV